MGSRTFNISASADDGHVRDTTFLPSGTLGGGSNGGIMIGNNYAACTAWLRYQNVDIPKGATITDAFLRVTARAATFEANVKISCVAEDNTSAPTSASDVSGYARTDGVVWNNNDYWSANTEHDSPDISSEIQDIVDRDGWESGNALTIIIDDNNSGNGDSRDIKGYEGGSSYVVSLHLTFNDPPVTSAGLAIGAEGSTIYAGRVADFLPIGATGSSFMDGFSQAGYEVGAEATAIKQGSLEGIAQGVVPETYNSSTDAYGEAGFSFGGYAESSPMPQSFGNTGFSLGAFAESGDNAYSGISLGVEAYSAKIETLSGNAGLLLGADGDSGHDAFTGISLGAFSTGLRNLTASANAGFLFGAKGESYNPESRAKSGFNLGAFAESDLVRVLSGAGGIALGAEAGSEIIIYAQAYAGISMGAEGKLLVHVTADAFAGLSMGAGNNNYDVVVSGESFSGLLHYIRD